MDLSGILMTLIQILGFTTLALLTGLVPKLRLRNWLLLITSVVAMYWLQPASVLRHFDFWLPSAALALTILSWITVRGYEGIFRREDIYTTIAIAAVVILLGLLRYLPVDDLIVVTRPPAFQSVMMFLLVFAGLGILFGTLQKSKIPIVDLLTLFIILLFVVLKFDPASESLSILARKATGQSLGLASAMDISWLGFSYIAFRLLHTLRDRRRGKLPPVSLKEYVTYVVFFPSLPAGPIDRIERFVKDLRVQTKLSPTGLVYGGGRTAMGILKKFVIADTLALIALNSVNVVQISSTFWLWIVLYAFAIMLYLDFSGYTDVAIGMGSLSGVRLPENFDRPYLKSNIASFWNSWHITLAQWFRAYVFNPLTRRLRKSWLGTSPALIIFIGQFTTMLLIGLWHGITWNFAIWGFWHAAGLFIHNRWVEFLKLHPDFLPEFVEQSRSVRAINVFLTFNFVALGWVWFALPSPEMAIQVFSRLFGGV